MTLTQLKTSKSLVMSPLSESSETQLKENAKLDKVLITQWFTLV
jgi:hypothetical protein